MNKISLKIIVVITFVVSYSYTFSQKTYSLSDVIELAQSQSIAAKRVANTYENKYWRYFGYKRSFLPSVTFNGTLPNLNIGISEIRLPDGTSNFIRTSQVNYAANFTINQSIPWTGGDLFFSADMARLDLLGGINTTSYRSSPFYVGYRQPIMRFNGYKWQKKIEPLEFEEAQKLSVEQKEDISIEAVQLFFEVVNNISRYEIAKINLANGDTLFRISQGRYNLGKIAESELLQIELTKLNAERNLAQSNLDVIISKQKLTTFLGLSPSVEFDLMVNEIIPQVVIDIPLAIKMAKEHRSEVVNFEKTLLQSNRELDRAKKENNLNADLFISYGVTQSGPTPESSVTDLLDQETVNLGVSIPIFNWGLNKARVKQQVANSELINIQIEQNKINFEREVFIQATQFNMMNSQVEIAKKSMIVAEKRYTVAKQRFLIGKSDILTFNNSLTERNQAVNSYNQTLMQYWMFYYQIRKLTHYDFDNNQLIEFNNNNEFD